MHVCVSVCMHLCRVIIQCIFSLTIRAMCVCVWVYALCIPVRKFHTTNAMRICADSLFFESILYPNLAFGFQYKQSIRGVVVVAAQIFVFFCSQRRYSLTQSINYNIFCWIRKITEIKEEVAKNVTWKCLRLYRIHQDILFVHTHTHAHTV